MDTHRIAIACLCDDMLTAMRHREDPQRHISDADIMTTALVAALFVGGKLAVSRWFLHTHGSIPRMVSTARFHRRRQRRPALVVTRFTVLGEHWNALTTVAIAGMAPVPIPVGAPCPSPVPRCIVAGSIAAITPGSGAPSMDARSL